MNSDEIIFLLGAGASCDAMLKSSDAMTVEVEKMLDGNGLSTGSSTMP